MGKILPTTKSGTIVCKIIKKKNRKYKITHENECYKCDMEAYKNECYKCGMEANDTSINIDLPNTLN